jgi:hypothetical protein
MFKGKKWVVLVTTVLDYGMFYENIRQNALQRTRARQHMAAN